MKKEKLIYEVEIVS